MTLVDDESDAKASSDTGVIPTTSSSLSEPPLAALAFALMQQDWQSLSLGDDPLTASTSSLDTLVERVTALMVVRLAAQAADVGTYSDSSTSTISARALKTQKWPAAITDDVVAQAREFVRRILAGYKDDVPYHNKEHAYHVILSTAKLLDMLCLTGKKTTHPSGNNGRHGSSNHAKYPCSTTAISFGLKHDNLLLTAQLFAALIHDVEHQGIPNRQLAMEDDRLAVLYNDQSIAENWSLYVAFSELLQDDFQALRSVLAPDRDEYLRFRKTVVNLVLCTDIASPERTQLGKSKWKEAFGDPYETVERKLLRSHSQQQMQAARRMSLTGRDVQIKSSGRRAMQRRGTGESALSELSDTYGFGGGVGGGGGDDDDSLSLTPENSVNGDKDEFEVGGGAGIQEDEANKLSAQLEALNANGNIGPRTYERRLSASSGRGKTYERRMSSSSRNTATSKYRVRLGILRTVDLSGEKIETYSRSPSMYDFSTQTSSEHVYSAVDVEADEPDELKATVVMETIMAAADVAHNLQGWEQMVKWSGRLYLELRKAHVEGRGGDPKSRWFENQIGFLESYLLPLAHRLEDSGVFGDEGDINNGCSSHIFSSFARTVEKNRDKWLVEGFDVSQQIVDEGCERFPMEVSPS